MRTLTPAATKHSEILKWAEKVNLANFDQPVEDEPPDTHRAKGKTRYIRGKSSVGDQVSGGKKPRCVSGTRPVTRKNNLLFSPPPTPRQSESMPKFPRLSSPEKQQQQLQQQGQQQQPQNPILQQHNPGQQSYTQKDPKQVVVAPADALTVNKSMNINRRSSSVVSFDNRSIMMDMQKEKLKTLHNYGSKRSINMQRKLSFSQNTTRSSNMPQDITVSFMYSWAVEKAACNHFKVVDGCLEEHPLEGIFTRRKVNNDFKKQEFESVQINKLPEIVQLIRARKQHLREQQKKKEEEMRLRQLRRQQRLQAEGTQQMDDDQDGSDVFSDTNDVRSMRTSVTSSMMIRLPRSQKGSVDYNS